MNISPKAKETTDRLNNFMDKHVYPNNETYHSQIENFGADRWQVVPVIEDLKKELNEEKETLEIRNKSLKGQIDNLNNQISEMQNKLTPVVQSLQENKNQNAPQ